MRLLTSRSRRGVVFDATGRGEYTFLHQHFAEYLAARHCARRLARAAENDTFNAEARAALQRCDLDAITAHALAILSADSRTLHLVERIVRILEAVDANGACQLMAASRVSIAGDYIRSVIARTDSSVHWRAVQAMRTMGADRAVDPLIGVVSDERVAPSTRAFAVEALGNLKSEKSVEFLVGVFCSPSTPRRLLEVTGNVLGRIGSLQAVSPLIEALLDPALGHIVRCHAAWCLGRLKDETAIVPLVRVIGDDRTAFTVKVGAAYALGAFQNERAIEALIHEARHGQVPSWVHTEMLRTLLHCQSPKAVGPLLELVANEEVGSDVKCAAVDVLGETGASKAVGPLQEIVNSRNSWDDIAVRAAFALARLGATCATALLGDLIGDGAVDERVRQRAIRTLAQADPSAAVTPLIGILDDDNTSALLFAEAIQNLALIESETPQIQILELCKNRKVLRCLKAAADWNTGALKPDAAVDVLATLATDATAGNGVRVVALNCLAQIASKRTGHVRADENGDAADDNDAHRPATAACNLASARKAEHALLQVAGEQDVDDALKHAVVVALGMLKSASAAESLMAVAGDRVGPPLIREFALGALAELRSPSTINALLNLIMNGADGGNVTRLARYALSKVVDEEAVKRMMEAAANNDGNTRRNVVEALRVVLRTKPQWWHRVCATQSYEELEFQDRFDLATAAGRRIFPSEPDSPTPPSPSGESAREVSLDGLKRNFTLSIEYTSETPPVCITDREPAANGRGNKVDLIDAFLPSYIELCETKLANDSAGRSHRRITADEVRWAILAGPAGKQRSTAWIRDDKARPQGENVAVLSAGSYANAIEIAMKWRREEQQERAGLPTRPTRVVLRRDNHQDLVLDVSKIDWQVHRILLLIAITCWARRKSDFPGDGATMIRAADYNRTRCEIGQPCNVVRKWLTEQISAKLFEGQRAAGRGLDTVRKGWLQEHGDGAKFHFNVMIFVRKPKNDVPSHAS